MLEKIQQLVDDSKDDRTPFQQFYVQYLMEVQDSNIDLEVSAAFKRASLEVRTLKQVDILIDKEHRKLVK